MRRTDSHAIADGLWRITVRIVRTIEFAIGTGHYGLNDGIFYDAIICKSKCKRTAR